MKSENSYSPAEIQAEHERLGHKLGWRLFTCPAQNIKTASVALITINPGGSTFEEPQSSVEAGSAYEIESWKKRPPGEENLQRQVRRMFAIMNVLPESVLSGYLVPFRSQRWQTLLHKPASVQFGINIWREVFKSAKVRTDRAPNSLGRTENFSVSVWARWQPHRCRIYRRSNCFLKKI